MKDNTIYFVAGTGRSGTTILTTIFATHPDLTDFPEWRLLSDPDGLLDFYVTMQTMWSPYLFDVKIRRLESFLKDMNQARLQKFLHYFDQLTHILHVKHISPYHLLPRYPLVDVSLYSPNYSHFVDELIEKLLAFHYKGEWIGNRFLQKKVINYAPYRSQKELSGIVGEFYRKFTADVIQYQQAKYFLEKNPFNLLWFDKILEILPEAKMVHIYRDPRDVVASYTKQYWAPSDPIQAAKWYQGIMNRWFEIRSVLPADTFMEISLEQLVQNPRETLEAICSFWRIEWSDNLLEIKLDKAHSGRWRKDFSQAEKEQIESMLNDEVQVLGYEM